MTAYAAKRETLVRFFAPRLGSIEAAEDLVADIGREAALAEAAHPIGDPSTYLIRLGAMLLSRRAAPTDTAAEEPASEAERRRLVEMVDAIEALSPAARLAFRLHKLDGLSQAETARAMGITLGMAERRIAEALAALAKRLRS